MFWSIIVAMQSLGNGHARRQFTDFYQERSHAVANQQGQQDQRLTVVIKGHPDGVSQLKTGTALLVAGYTRKLVSDGRGNVETIETLIVRVA